MNRFGYATILVATALAVAACSGPAPGTLDIEILGAPAGADLAVEVTSSGGQVTEVDASGSVQLDPGSYTVSLADGLVASATFVGDERFVAADRQATVVSGETTDVTLTVSYDGFVIEDPDDDAVGTDPRYELVEVRSSTAGTDLRIEIVLAAGQTDLTGLIGFLSLDVDQDDGTGNPSVASIYCATGGDDVGAEYEVEFVVGAGQAALTDLVGGAPDVMLATDVNDNVFAILVPIASIGGDARIDVATIVGNIDNPSDCVPFGQANP